MFIAIIIHVVPKLKLIQILKFQGHSVSSDQNSIQLDIINSMLSSILLPGHVFGYCCCWMDFLACAM